MAPLWFALALLAAQNPQVWIFVRTDCPIANRYAPTIERLYQMYGKQGVDFLLVYPEPGATAPSVEQHRKAYGLTAPYALDPKQERVRKAQIQVTPEVAVYSREGRLVYRGRIDDRQASLGAARQSVSRRDLAEVLDAILAGQTPAFRETKAFGCAIEAAPR